MFLKRPPGQSETKFILLLPCSFDVAVAAGGLGTVRIFQIDFSYLCNENLTKV